MEIKYQGEVKREPPSNEDMYRRLEAVANYEHAAQGFRELAQWACGEITRQQARIEELEGIVERLPKTADGVRVMPGDSVWHPQQAAAHALDTLRQDLGLHLIDGEHPADTAKRIKRAKSAECEHLREALVHRPKDPRLDIQRVDVSITDKASGDHKDLSITITGSDADKLMLLSSGMGKDFIRFDFVFYQTVDVHHYTPTHTAEAEKE